MGTNVLPVKKSFVHSHRVPLHMKQMISHYQFIFAKNCKKDEKLSCSGVGKNSVFIVEQKFHILNELRGCNILCTC